MSQSSNNPPTWNQLKTLPIDHVYILDTNLVVAYVKDEIPGWKEWANSYLATGRQFLLLPPTIKALNGTIPINGFISVKLESERFVLSQRIRIITEEGLFLRPETRPLSN